MSLAWKLDEFTEHHSELEDRPDDWVQFVQSRCEDLDGPEDATTVLADLILLSWAAIDAHDEDAFHVARRRVDGVTSLSNQAAAAHPDESRSQCHASVSNQH